MKLKITEGKEPGTIEYYREEYLPAMDNKELVKHLETITLQNSGTRGEYSDMISAIEQEILSRMR